jgi:hypothetical protein
MGRAHFNLATMLRESRNAKPDHPLCDISDLTFSYAQVDEISGRVASALLGSGLRRGDKVAVQLPNLPQFLFTYFAILKAGLVMVPLNPLLKAPEVAYQLQDSQSRMLITFEGFAAEAAAGARQAGNVPTYVVNLLGNDQRPEGTTHYDELYFADDTGEIEPVNADDTAVIIYTSGTTGKPKGAELTHFQLYMNCTVAGDLFGFRDDDVGVAVLPMFHVFGLSSVLNVAVRFAGTLVLIPRFEPDAVLDAIERHRCTIFSGVPTMYYALLQADLAGRDLSSLRVGISGGAAIPGEVIRAFEEKFPGVVILEGYGLSETASTTTFNISAERRKVLSIGKPIWGVEVGLGRYLPRIQRVAEQVPELNIIVATGLYTYHSVPFFFYHRGPALNEALGAEVPDPMVDMFVADITEGITGTGVRAGMLKCAIDDQGMTPGVERVMRAVAAAHHQTGVPITVHTHPGSRTGLEVKRVLCDSAGGRSRPGGARPQRRHHRLRPSRGTGRRRVHAGHGPVRDQPGDHVRGAGGHAGGDVPPRLRRAHGAVP